MISEAIKKIDEEMEGASSEIQILGNYVKNILLTKEDNAVKILAPNTDLETFMERLEDVAKDIVKGKYHKEAGEIGRLIIAKILGQEPENIPLNESIGKRVTQVKSTDAIGLTSEFILPLLHIYYGIDNTAQEEPKPKRRSFRAVSLDD